MSIFFLTLSCCWRCRDLDPEGAKLAATEDPLGEATKLVSMLKQHAGGRPGTHLAAFEVKGMLVFEFNFELPIPPFLTTRPLSPTLAATTLTQVYSRKGRLLLALSAVSSPPVPPLPPPPTQTSIS